MSNQDHPVVSKITLSQSARWLFQRSFNTLQQKTIGQILTVVDACIADAEQRKGIKSLVRQSFDTLRDLEIRIGESIEHQIAQACGDAKAVGAESDSLLCSSDMRNIVLDDTDYEYIRKEV